METTPAPLMSRPCLACGDAYGGHSLDALAQCMEDALGEPEPVWSGKFAGQALVFD